MRPSRSRQRTSARDSASGAQTLTRFRALSSDDVEQYFNYMGCLAVEGTYDRMYALLDGA